jgi:hypothetical protein
MTTPDRFRRSQWAIERGRFNSHASSQTVEAAQSAIEETRQLLSELSQAPDGGEDESG